MEHKLKTAAWICLSVSLLFLYPAIKGRQANENLNKSFIQAADMNEFITVANEAGLDMDKMLDQMLEAGIKTAAIVENNKIPQDEATENIPVFDEMLMSHLKSHGFDILLRPVFHSSCSIQTVQAYEKILGNYNIKTIIFDKSSSPASDEYINMWLRMVDKYDIKIGLIEAPGQLGHQDCSYLSPLINGSGYSINCAHIIPSSILSSLSGEDMFYRWLRCIVDRNIRIIYVRPLKNPLLSPLQNINNTLDWAGYFNRFTSRIGYVPSRTLPELSSNIHGTDLSLPLFLSLFASFWLYMLYITAIKSQKSFYPKAMALLLVAGMSSVLLEHLNLLEHTLMCKIYALATSIFYPSLSSILILFYLNKKEHHILFFKIIFSLFIMLCVNAVGMYIVSAALSDIRFMMNLEWFYGVPFAYIVPIIIFVASYCNLGRLSSVKPENLQLLLSKLKSPEKLAGVLLALLAFYVYISRSGDYSLIPASKIELEIRKNLEFLFIARPRFKEFLIGYPSLFIFVLIYDKNVRNFVTAVFGAGMTICGISMVNSFCHGFTSIKVSSLRVLNGIFLGIPFAIISLLGAMFFISSYKKYKSINAHSNK